MKKYYNNNERYGDAGPFEAESREALADEMMPTFELWAREAAARGEAASVAKMREEFITGLDEVDE